MRLAGWVGAVLLSLSLQAAAPEPVRADVFVSGTGGYAMYRIPGIAVTARGTLLAWAEARRTGASDWDGIDIVMRRSEDGGRTWSAQRVIGTVAGTLSQNPAAPSRGRAAGAITYNNPVAIAGAERGLVHFLFCVEYMRAFYMRSTDDGRSFSAPREITVTFDQFRPEYPWKVLATGPGHGIRLKNGRLLVPVWLSTSEGGNAHRPSVAATIYSDDGGQSWHRGEIAVRNERGIVNPSETVAAQLSDGRVMLNVRTESAAHRRLIVVSSDGASKWSEPRFQDELLEPVCFGSLVRAGSKRLLFVNPDNLLRGGTAGEPGRSRDRKNLTVQLSEDDGATWKVKRVIDPGPAGYADINVGRRGEVYCLYERGDRVAALTLVRFPLSWLIQ